MAKPKKKIPAKKTTGKTTKPARKAAPAKTKAKPRVPTKVKTKKVAKVKKVVKSKTPARTKTKPITKSKPAAKTKKVVKSKVLAKTKKVAKAKPKTKPVAKAKKIVNTKASAKPVKASAKVKKRVKAKTEAKPTKQKSKVTMPKVKASPRPKTRPKPAAKAKLAAAENKPQRTPISMEKSSKKKALRVSILARKSAPKPIGFSLDEVRAIAKTFAVKTIEEKPTIKSKTVSAAAIKALAASQKPVKPHHVQAASLADILGFNPNKSRRKASAPDAKPVAEKHKRFYKLLLDMRSHLSAGIELHSEETLKRSAKDDSGDLSSYGQHMADAGTDTFDRDFALSLVSSEQEALSEIEAAIKRVYNGSYGICEITGKPIGKDRLLAVPFTRYSTEAQKDIERNRHRTRTQAGLFGEHGEETGKMMDSEDD